MHPAARGRYFSRTWTTIFAGRVSDQSKFKELAGVITRWRDDPVRFVREALRADPEPWQEQALKVIAKEDRLAIRSGHGVGKSAFLSWLVLWWLLTRAPAKVACTAPSAHQLEDVLWGEIAKWHRRLQRPFRDWLSIKSDRVELVGAEQMCFAAARTARKEQPEAFQGFHSENMLFIADEASGIHDIIFEVGEGAMSTPGAKTVLTGNPTRTSGYFFRAFHPRRGDPVENPWHLMRVSCEESKQVKRKFIQEMAATYGEHSNIFRIRVLGEFPTANDDAVIPLNLIEEAADRVVEPNPKAPVVWGLDVARFGRARTALAKRRANVLLEPIKWWREKDLMQTCGLIKLEYDVTPPAERPAEILVDVIGMGAGVVDRLRELGLPAYGVNVAESPSVGEQFLRLRDELWWRCREWFQRRDCSIPRDEELIADLSGPTYGVTSNGRVKVESKADMEKRGVKSPDLADALCLTFAMYVGYAVAPKAIDYSQLNKGVV